MLGTDIVPIPEVKTVRVTKFGTDEIALEWENLRPLIEKAEEYYEDFYSVGDLLRLLMNGALDLWAFSDEDRGIFAVVITEILRYPRGPVLRFSLLAGEDHAAVVRYMGIIEQWAAISGAVKLQVPGRSAWAKLLKECGYTQSCVVLEKNLVKPPEEMEQ